LLFGTGDPVAGGRKGDVCLYSIWRRDSFDRGNSFRRAARCFCFRFEQSDTEENSGGESVSQSPLKDQAFSSLSDQNPPFPLRPENGISPSTKARPVQWTVIDNSAIKRLAKGKLRSHRSA
jgi:hypothetical protein